LNRSKKINPIHQLVRDSIHNNTTLSVIDLRKLRSLSEQKVKTFKISFWVAIAIINLMIWVPLPFRIPGALLITIGVVCAGYAFSVPIVMIRKHQQSLELLKLVSQGPKRRSASDAGQKYIDRVKQEGRSFIQAEVDLLEGSRYPADQSS
jgi:hypothetical protein